MYTFEATPPELRALLPRRINQLGLKLEGSPLERHVNQLYRELERKGLACFRPGCYLTNEWGCPSEQPIIGIPFYLADPALARLEKEINDLEDEREIARYLRHEAGHAFNYAYRLYETPEWRELFGPFHRPYREKYRPVPFDRNFVRHIEGWYAQKHPDEDFAETFAVWLTPRSRWRQRYKAWPALRKLRYVERTTRSLAAVEPSVRLPSADITVEEMDLTLEEFYRRNQPESTPVDVALENDLPDFFVRKGRRKRGIRPAAEMIREQRIALIDKIQYWTGVRRSVVRALIDGIEQASARLQLFVETSREATILVELTTYATTLSMNHLTRGSFVPRFRQPQRTHGGGPSRKAKEANGETSDRDRARA